ncbi:DUF4331 family protein [Agromyces aureus]|uniref:DUF4331 domain-containing protein n=1 Tax=Agromyces aureus TaxID=453304 RepID=A0A191WG14_9MICO|nr:DUF4331 family protein [Agromyces aureus]ANJ27167.1 hypothetical protein ATC03_10955 [Agromyces aureus]
MSHHLDSPLARQDVRLDITDLYVFRGETGTVLAINVCHSLGGGVPEVGFHPEGMYEIKIDLNDDSVEDLTYRFQFGFRTAGGSQHFLVHRLDGAEAAHAFAEGTLVAMGETDTPASGTDGIRVWTGKAGDPFWIDPTMLHAVGHAVQDGASVDLGDWTPAQAMNAFAGHSVYAIVLEIPDQILNSDVAGEHRIGVWAVSSLRTDAGGWRSINRIGLPMLHPLFAQVDEQLGEELNAGRPLDDPATFGALLGKKIAGFARAYGTTADPAAHGARFVGRFLPNILPYTVGTPAEFGFVDINGRALTDNAADVMFTIAANTPITMAIGPESVTEKPSAAFPYVPAVPAGR